MPRIRRSRRVRIAYRYLALSLAGLGALGMVLPLFPGTVFLIASVWAANRSSPALAMKIRRNRHFGPVIASWERHGAVPVYAKVMATVLMSLSWLKLWWFNAPPWLLIGLGLGFIAIAVFLLSRPSPTSIENEIADRSVDDAKHQEQTDHGNH
jgi:uncharacterized membrane protein YbaN (DUF454 family)